MRASLITLSGLDGCGKSTQTMKLLDLFRGQGQRPVYLWSRGGYTQGMESLKKVVRMMAKRALPPPGHSPQRDRAFHKSRVRRTWLRLALLDLIRVYGVQVRVWLSLGRPVVCDRYLWDTLVDFGMAFPQEDVAQWTLWRLVGQVAPRPDVSVFLELPADEAWRRAKQKGDPFLLDPAAMARRKNLYDMVMDRAGWTILDARKEPDAVFAEIQSLLDV